MCVRSYLTSKTVINDICARSLRLCHNSNDASSVNDMIDAFTLCLTRFDVYRDSLHTSDIYTLDDILITHENDVL